MSGQSKPSFLLLPFRPPFKGLLWVVWVFFVCTFLAHPISPILKGCFYDPDDFVHGVRFIDWMNGQNWFDPFLYRLSPPEGVISHFSRLAELPLFLFAAPAHAFGLSWTGATLVAGAFYPLALFMGFLLLLRVSAKSLLGASWANLTAFTALFSGAFLFQYAPGRIDHHGLGMVAVLGALYATLKNLRSPRKITVAVTTGLVFALAQTIALETVPWLVLMAGWMGFWLVYDGSRRAKSVITFGLSYVFFCTALLALTRSQSTFFNLDTGYNSFLYVLMASAIATLYIINGCAGLYIQRIPRIAFGLLTCASALGIFYVMLPLLIANREGNIDTRIYAFIAANIGEAEPFYKKLQTNLTGTLFLHAQALFNLVVTLWMAWRYKNGLKHREWMLYALLTVASTTAMMVTQNRYIFYLYLFTLTPVAAFLRHNLTRLSRRPLSYQRFFSEVLLVILVGPLLTVLAPSFVKQGPVVQNLFLFPADRSKGMRVPGVGILRELNDPAFLGKESLLIMNTLNEGASILFYTDHKALAAPYHMNVKGNLMAIDFFGATKDEEARRVLKESKADLILMAKDNYAYFNNPYTKSNADKMTQEEQMKDSVKPKTFGDKLASGETPEWITPIWVFLSGEYLLFKVEKDKL